MIKIVGLIGEPECGKDTIADFAIEKLGARRIAFADPIRECALAIDPIVTITVNQDGATPPESINVYRLSDVVSQLGWREAKKIPEIRRLLQRIGTEMGREVILDDIWIQLGFRRLMAYHNGSGGELDRFVFTDVRFENEAEGIAKFAEQVGGKFTLIRVRRPGYGVVNDHASESSYDKISANNTIVNDGSLEDLQAKVINTIGEFYES